MDYIFIQNMKEISNIMSKVLLRNKSDFFLCLKHFPLCIYEGCSKRSKPHPDFRFVEHLSHLYALHLHLN